MKKMYVTTQPKKDSNVITIKPKKGRVQLTTCRSAVYSHHSKATRKSEHQLKNALRRLDLDRI